MGQFHYFNDSSILTKFIKSLVNTTNLPLLDYWRPGKPAKKDTFYLTENYIVKCVRDNNVDDPQALHAQSIFDTNFFELVEPYVFGEVYRSFTGTFESKYEWYDAETHKYLGKYLRMLRDFKHINLMYMYNCATPLEYKNIRINTIPMRDEAVLQEWNHPFMDVTLDTKFDANDGYKVITCPIIYDQDYTIYINSSLPIKMCAIYFDGINSIFDYPVDNSFLYKNSTTFSTPIHYCCKQSVKNAADSIYRNLLTLIIQVPKKCNNIVVLEGNYLNTRIINTEEGNQLTQNIFGFKEGQSIANIDNNEMDILCPAISNLTRTLQNKMAAFDLELIPHLLYHIIEPNDEISENIARVQEFISSYNFFKLYGIRYTIPYKRGIWDNNLRKFIYDLMFNGIKRNGIIVIDKKPFNTAGYIDRDVEEIIERGQNGNNVL